jgi:hypothetical protein
MSVSAADTVLPPRGCEVGHGVISGQPFPVAPPSHGLSARYGHICKYSLQIYPDAYIVILVPWDCAFPCHPKCLIIKSYKGLCARMREKRNVYRLLVGKPEGKRPLGRPRRRWIDNIKMDF